MGLSNRYPTEFKAEAIALARTSGRKKKEIAGSLNISTQTLHVWLRAVES